MLACCAVAPLVPGIGKAYSSDVTGDGPAVFLAAPLQYGRNGEQPKRSSHVAAYHILDTHLITAKELRRFTAVSFRVVLSSWRCRRVTMARPVPPTRPNSLPITLRPT